MSETSNLIRYTSDQIKSKVSSVFAEIDRRTDEQFVESRLAVNNSEHVRLGLTDSVLLTLASADGAALLTVDLDLYLAALHAGLSAINYNHVRDGLRADFNNAAFAMAEGRRR